MTRPVLLVLAVFLTSTTLFAQFDVNGPNAVQKIQGLIGSQVDPIDHDVDLVLPGTFRLGVESGSNPNMPIATIMTWLQPKAGEVPTPWGGSIDVGSWDPNTTIADIVVIGDAITYSGDPNLNPLFVTDAGNASTGAPPSFEISAFFSASAIPSGQLVDTRAFQSIVYDPTNAPFNLDNTEATDVNFRRGQATVLKTGDDGFVTVSFLTGSFSFHGQTYGSVTVCANGFVTFGGPPTTANLGADGDHVAWLQDRPSIAACLCDWDPSAASVNDGVWFEEVDGKVTIAWGDPRASSAGGIAHAGDVDSNHFRLVLQLDDGMNARANTFAIEFPSLDPLAGALLGNGLVGHTPGGAALLGGGWDLGLRLAPGSAPVGFAQVEEHDASGGNVADLGFDGLGSRRHLNDFVGQWQGAELDFAPRRGFTTPGDQGYVSLPVGVAVESVAGLVGTDKVDVAGGQMLTVCGSFESFDPQGNGLGSAVFDPDGLQGGPYPAGIEGILDGSGLCGSLARPNPQPGEHRDGQALRILTPALGGVTAATTLRVGFASGTTIDLPVNIGTTTPLTTTYALNDDEMALFNLTVPIWFYGQRWTDFWLSSNGFVSFGNGSAQSLASIAVVEGGLDQIGTRTVCALFTDLNPLGTFSGATYVINEDLAQGVVEVVFKDQYFWSSFEPAGTVAIRFGKQGPGSVELDYGLYHHALVGAANVVIGVSDGDPGTPVTDFSNGQGTGMFLQTQIGGGSGFLSPGGSHALLESFPQTANVPASKLVFRDLATAPPYGLWWLY
ncbi:MAG: hypothetical protein H6807_04845 [Planctomycetes bacterium]|nr:hypothetical protein [Planctomycetota bacterium]